MSNIKAYIYGLIFPKLIFAKIENHPDFYLLAPVNHSKQLPPSDTDLFTHRVSLKAFLDELKYEKKFKFCQNLSLRYIKPDILDSRKSNTIGFSILFYLNEQSLNEKLVNNLRNLISEDIRNSFSPDFAKYFIAGTIDGRASVDKTAKFISLDIDSSDSTKETLQYVCQNLLGLEININNRNGRSDSSRNNQLRYKKESIISFLKINPKLLLSIFRMNQIKQYILT